MNLELFIARRIHFSKEGNRQVTPPAVRIAIVGVALGLAVMILSVAIVIGFKKEVRNKVIGFGSHIQITNFDNNSSYETTPIAVSDSLLQALREFPGIKHIEGYATKMGILKTDSDFQGVVLKGIDTDYDWSFFRNNLKEGELLTIDPKKTSTDVIISRYLSDLLGLKLGDSILTYFVQEDVRARKFNIVGIYDPMIFNWLDVLDVNVVVILILIFAVAGFTMISGLLIIILERTNMIGILKALGENNVSIRKIFLYISFFLIGKGMLWGNVVGIAICLIQSHFRIIKLDPSIYYLDAVPIDLSIVSLILLNIGTLCASMLMMLGPSYLITKIDPAKSIRFE